MDWPAPMSSRKTYHRSKRSTTVGGGRARGKLERVGHSVCRKMIRKPTCERERGPATSVECCTAGERHFCLYRLIDFAVRNELGPYLARRPLPTVADDHARCQVDNAEVANPQEQLRTSPLHDAASDERESSSDDVMRREVAQKLWQLCTSEARIKDVLAAFNVSSAMVTAAAG